MPLNIHIQLTLQCVCVCVCSRVRLRTLYCHPLPRRRSFWGTIPVSHWAAPTTSHPFAAARWWHHPVRSSAAQWWRRPHWRRGWGEFLRWLTTRRWHEPAEVPRTEEQSQLKSIKPSNQPLCSRYRTTVYISVNIHPHCKLAQTSLDLFWLWEITYKWQTY